jgi:quercetin dioxygenase-like cupin family protein
VRPPSTIVTAVVLAAVAAAVSAQAPLGPNGIGRRPVFDNATVDVAQLLLLPGARETPHTHTSPMIIIQLSRGTFETRNGTVSGTRTREPGEVEFVGVNSMHAAANPGVSPFELIVVTLNPARVRGGTADAQTAPPGITRRGLIDNSDATISRVDFAPAAREPVHTHPYDLVVVPIRAAMLDLQVGTARETRGYAAGEAIFIARNQRHAVANPGPEAFAVVAIAVK